ncbi:winged helix-turn-helix domain-containing protein [Methanococcus voltae]|uniref:DNA-binding HxlR family transcriptional regulator n=2 Tax=Methanococcus voltae TaxID=2188 RepID=A0A8J7RQ69_METVO|nr:winged helix-turn-helix domain-containing protein [Methanococcus voltae]MBP2173119.1 DNA-binding HxlR family transcriptional regulator [Methanococcus voltae]MBP2202249.1 DNA-binding HxlR family transcriptional regulator [Methanococcus voltae]MCS3921943.1 DNA-binding HxlR family transcriptional regulator [Methanococcus voltae PS]
MILKSLSKSNMRKILEIIKEHEQIYFGELMDISEISKGALGRAIRELYELKIIGKKEVTGTYKFPRTYYYLTPIGKKAFEIFNLGDELDNEIMNFNVQVLENNGVIANKIENLEFSINNCEKKN